MINKQVISDFKWQKEAESYFNSTPHPKLWFEILEWVTALTTLKFLTDKTNSIYIEIAYYFSYIVLYNYLQKSFMTIRFQKYLPARYTDKVKSIMTYILTIILVSLAYMYVSRIVEDIVKGLKL